MIVGSWRRSAKTTSFQVVGAAAASWGGFGAGVWVGSFMFVNARAKRPRYPLLYTAQVANDGLI